MIIGIIVFTIDGADESFRTGAWAANRRSTIRYAAGSAPKFGGVGNVPRAANYLNNIPTD